MGNIKIVKKHLDPVLLVEILGLQEMLHMKGV
jgi:hypothetical protein